MTDPTADLLPIGLEDRLPAAARAVTRARRAALDRPRFRVERGHVLLEEGLWGEAEALERLGLRPVCEHDVRRCGSGQAILEADRQEVGGGVGHRQH